MGLTCAGTCCWVMELRLVKGRPAAVPVLERTADCLERPEPCLLSLGLRVVLPGKLMLNAFACMQTCDTRMCWRSFGDACLWCCC